MGRFANSYSNFRQPAIWANQGVFLLNAILTVQANSPASHQKKGWEEFTDAVISKLSESGRELYLCCGGILQKVKLL
jgi:uracil-DNA glycosylase